MRLIRLIAISLLLSSFPFTHFQVIGALPTPLPDFSGAWNIRGYADFFWNDGLLAPACIAVVLGVVLLVWRKRAIGLVWFRKRSIKSVSAN